MASLATSSNPHSPFNMARWARKCERYCCLGATYFPLFFVYSLTSWAAWVEASIGFEPTQSVWIGKTTSLLGILLFLLLNWSYTTAVFTNPGSTTESYDGYNSLPTTAPPVATSFTVKSTGELRFCKKCQARKPDRAHHCSTCKRCVLKMDHHCPWLATCVGLRNYKAFLLFLIYTTVFCFLCFGVSGTWFWIEVLNDGTYGESLMPINYVMLAVMSGIIGLVLAGFTGWHILLASRGQTTIECLEKTRYLSPLRKALQHQHIANHEEGGELSYGQQLVDLHTNALPGVTRPEEGETVVTPNVNGEPYAHQSYDAHERQKARQRYEEYLDEQDSEKLPSAFDLGWKKNLLHLFGRRKALWFIPIVTTTGNGWSWEPSPKWLQARERMRQDREVEHNRASAAGWGSEAPYDAPHARQRPVKSVGAGRHYLSSPSRSPGVRSPSKADRVLGRDTSQYTDIPESRMSNSTPMNNLRSGDSDDEYASSNDGFEAQERETDRRTGGWTGQRVTTASGLLGKQSPIGMVRSESGNSWREPRNSEEVD